MFSLPTEDSGDCSGETGAVNESVSSVATSTDVAVKILMLLSRNVSC